MFIVSLNEDFFGDPGDDPGFILGGGPNLEPIFGDPLELVEEVAILDLSINQDEVPGDFDMGVTG